MNRKCIAGFAAGVMALSLVFSGCGDKEGGKEDTTKPRVEQKSEEEKKIETLEFSTKNLEDKSVDSKLFKDYKLTMVNLWATFCKPCISEMPDIQKVYEEEKENGINVIGIVADIRDEKDTDMKTKAKDMISKTGVKYENIIADKNLATYFAGVSDAVPTTIFIDSNGKIIGDPIVGTRTKEEYKSIIKQRLNVNK